MNRLHSLTLRLLALVAVAGALVGAARLADDADREWWQGTVDVGGAALKIAVVFTPAADDAGPTARISIPVQSFLDQPLTNVVYTDEELKFTIAAAGAVFEAHRTTADTAEGVLKQRGLEFPLHLHRVTAEAAAAAEPARPQTPKPPFPYTARDVTFENPDDHTKLAGTLTIPPGPGPHPAVILITGSGAQDRDETIFNHKPFLVLADHLTRHGIAVLRCDDRGVGGSGGSVATATAEDFAGDVLAGMAFLKQQDAIDAHRIGLIGHSEGGIIAPIVAARSHDVACIVLLAGPAFPGAEILHMQTEALLRAAGVAPDKIAAELAAHQRLLDVLTGDDADLIMKRLRELTELQLHRDPNAAQPTPAQLDASLAAAFQQLRSPWMQSFLKLDPRAALRQVRCPVLALIGTKDLQVPAAQNLPEIERTLRAAGNDSVTVKSLPGLNHLFQEANTGLVAEYGQIEQTMAPVAFETITDWLRACFKLPTTSESGT